MVAMTAGARCLMWAWTVYETARVLTMVTCGGVASRAVSSVWRAQFTFRMGSKPHRVPTPVICSPGSSADFIANENIG